MSTVTADSVVRRRGLRARSVVSALLVFVPLAVMGEHLGLTQIPHLTLSGRHSGRAACVQVTASGHVGQSEVIGRPLVVACWVLAAITCRCGLLSG